MNIKDLDLNLLSVFHAIYEARSISAAADQLDLSQPGMSHALKRLRTQLDDKLFVRKGNGVEPTVYAETIAEPIRNALSFLETSLSPKSAFDPKTSTRHFRLILADFLEAMILPSIIEHTIDNPNITFELVSSQSIRLEDAILDGSVDVVVHLQTDMMHEISTLPLFPIEPVLAYRMGHPIMQEPNPAAAFGKYRKLALNLKSGAVLNLDKAKLVQNTKRDYFGLVHNLRSLPPLLAKSDCVALIPKLFVLDIASIYGLGYTRFPVDVMKQDFTMSWHRRNDEDSATTWLRGIIRDVIEQHKENAKGLLD